MNQAEIDALRREHSGAVGAGGSHGAAVHSGHAAVQQDLRSSVTPPGTPSLPPLALDTGEKRPTSPFMAPLNLDGVASPQRGGGGEKTPTSAATARTDGSVDEPCTYEVEGIGGRIPRGVSVDLTQMGMEEWDDPAPAAPGAGGDAVRDRASLDNPGGQPPMRGEPVDTWNLVLDNPPSGMMTALDDCVDGVDAVNEMGYTCVMWAALYGKEEHLIVLLECEADVSMQLQEDYYSKTYPAGSTALDIARITQEKTGSDRKLIIEMLTAASELKWDEWKASEKGAKVWRKYQEKWEKDKQRREREEKTKREREQKRKLMERRAVQRVRDNPFAASTQTVSTWLNSLGHDLGQYAAVFDTQAVDGATLMSLTEKHLKEELKVRTLGQRLRILRARNEALGIAARVPFATKEQVGLWMTQIGLSMYSYAFESNEIDGLALCALTEEQLRDDLHVRTLGHRLKILNLREDFREQCGGTNPENDAEGEDGGVGAADGEQWRRALRRAAEKHSGGGSSVLSSSSRVALGGGEGPGALGRRNSGTSSDDASLRRGTSTAQESSGTSSNGRSRRRGGKEGNGGTNSNSRSQGGHEKSSTAGGGVSKGKGHGNSTLQDSERHRGRSNQQDSSGRDVRHGSRLILGMSLNDFKAGFVVGGLVSVVLPYLVTYAINRMLYGGGEDA